MSETELQQSGEGLVDLDSHNVLDIVPEIQGIRALYGRCSESPLELQVLASQRMVSPPDRKLRSSSFPTFTSQSIGGLHDNTVQLDLNIPEDLGNLEDQIIGATNTYQVESSDDEFTFTGDGGVAGYCNIPHTSVEVQATSDWDDEPHPLPNFTSGTF